jgi:heptose-I-phosphate ethanolaminephosphotransferase
MRKSQNPVFSWKAFFVSLIGLMGLLTFPELVILVKNKSDFSNLTPIAYYICIVSFIMVTPGLWLPKIWAQIWITLIGIIALLSTLITSFQALIWGARWDLTAHSAMMQTYPQQAWEFVSWFSRNPNLLWLVVILIGFSLGIWINVRSEQPRCRFALLWTISGLVISGFGIHNFIKYGRNVFSDVPVSDGTYLRIAGVGENNFHPVVLLALTHYNFRSTHNFYLEAYRKAASNSEVLMNANTKSGALSPRILLVVIGETASRRHWSLYGYERNTTPKMEALRDELIVFSNVISEQVGTQESIRSILNVPSISQPVFPLFEGAGYQTHWYSTKPDQGHNDTEISAIVQSCNHRLYLNNQYDENLVGLVERAVAMPGNHVIFLNLFGSHVRYGDRYPAEQSFFTGNSAKNRIIAEYDNSIRYTDTVLHQLIDVLKSRPEPSALIYTSDHAEDVYDSTPDEYLSRSDALATDPMYEVPFIVWMSPEYRRANSQFVEDIKLNCDKGATTRELYQSMIDLARLTHPIHDSSKSLFSSKFLEGERRVGAMKRIYNKPTTRFPQ